MSEYKATIGLEIHAELKTKSKMFCGCANAPHEAKPNQNICPVCMGHPGTLPVVNKEAVRNVLRVGAAIGGELADFTEFDRKNYFYPDIPKSYQISQYKYPLVKGGSLAGVALTRIHLEEDTAKSYHEEGDGSLVDYNRAGVPLMELVTEPVIHDAETAGNFARELQLLLQYLGASDANMEKGEMRVEANISISKTEKFGTKVEVKNLNSFRAVEKAIAYEIARHAKLLDAGEKIVQETRGWDENTQKTFSQRLKEDSHDYRYFPDPDIPKFMISKVPEFSLAELKNTLPELPWEMRARYTKDFGLKSDDIDILVNTPDLAKYFEQLISTFGKKDDVKGVQLLSNYLISDYVGILKKNSLSLVTENLEKISTGHFVEVINMVVKGDLSSRGAKDLILALFTEGCAVSPQKMASDKGLIQKSDEGELTKIIQGIIDANPKVVAEVVAGKEVGIQFLIGQTMKATKGSANPEVAKTIIKKLLKLS